MAAQLDFGGDSSEWESFGGNRMQPTLYDSNTTIDTVLKRYRVAYSAALIRSTRQAAIDAVPQSTEAAATRSPPAAVVFNSTNTNVVVLC